MFPLALEIGSIDGDDYGEIFIKEALHEPLSIYGWNGNSYDLEGTLNDYDTTFDEGLLIDEIITPVNSQLIVGSLNTTIIEYDNDYSGIWASETYEWTPQSVEIADIDDSWSNELILAIESSLFIYSAKWPPNADLLVDNDTVFIGEEIVFNGSNSLGDKPLDYFFDFGDGENIGWITEPVAIHSYSASGTYIASLKVRDRNNFRYFSHFYYLQLY